MRRMRVGLEFWSDSERSNLDCYRTMLSVSVKIPAVPIPLVRREFSMMIAGIHYGVIAPCTEKKLVEGSIKGTSEIVESDPAMSTGPWENIRSPAKYDDCKSELDELEVEP